MKHIMWVVLVSLLVVLQPPPAAMQSAGPPGGTLVLSGGGEMVPDILDAFLEHAGNGSAIVYIPISQELPETASSWSALETQLSERFNADVSVLHSNDRSDWDSDAFAEILERATAVWISGGSQGHLANLMLDTRSHAALGGVLQRGGVVGGQSGGAMIATSFILRGAADKPTLIARGHTRGFGFLRDVVINPHLTERRRENELVTTLDLYPELLGVGIDEGTAIVVQRNAFTIVGRGRVAIYDNTRHGSAWFYDLDPAAVFDLRTRAVQQSRQ